MVKTMPKVSVVLPVYKEPSLYIAQSIQSILKQKFKNFELIIIIDTGVNDSEFERIYYSVLHEVMHEERVKIIINERNMGLTATLNKAIEVATGDYIARMDADDIALPNRLEMQYEFMEQDKDVFLCGSPVLYINALGEILGVSKFSDDIATKLYMGISPIPHPTWFFRKETFFKLGGYKSIPWAEDFELLARAVLSGERIAMLKEPTLMYRITFSRHRISTKRVNQLKVTFLITRNFRKGKTTQPEEAEKVLAREPHVIVVKLDEASLWLDRLMQHYFPCLYHYLKWFAYVVSPYKLYHLLSASFAWLFLKLSLTAMKNRG